jgi:hypothetical protein
MGAFSKSAFSTSAFSVDAFLFDFVVDTIVIPVLEISEVVSSVLQNFELVSRVFTKGVEIVIDNFLDFSVVGSRIGTQVIETSNFESLTLISDEENKIVSESLESNFVTSTESLVKKSSIKIDVISTLTEDSKPIS